MFFQKMGGWYGKCTNIFFLSKLLGKVSQAMLILLAIAVVALLSFVLFSNSSKAIPEGCSLEYGKAIAENNLLLCETITTFQVRWEYDNYCREHCKAELGMRNRNPEQCEDIQRLREGVELYPSLRDECFTAVARGLKDASLCARAENPAAQEECVKLK